MNIEESLEKDVDKIILYSVYEHGIIAAHEQDKLYELICSFVEWLVVDVLSYCFDDCSQIILPIQWLSFEKFT